MDQVLLKQEMLIELLSFFGKKSDAHQHYNDYTEEHPACPCCIRWEYMFNIGPDTKWGIHGYLL